MKYHEAAEIIAKDGQYASADFYRMQYAQSIALGLHDQPVYILADVVNHGSEHAKALLQTAVDRGHVVQTQEDQHTFYDVVDSEDVAGAPFQFRSHIAMQIAYPELYWEYYEGEHVWTYSHPKMQKLLELCVSCLTNKKHPSDYYGEHEIPDEKRKPGRPKLEKTKADIKKSGHNEWVQACQDHKQSLSDAWAAYMQACAQRKADIPKWEEWLEQQLEPLEEQIAAIRQQYEDGLKDLDHRIQETHKLHAKIKATPKPLRKDFE